jgi:hypothetical protein
MTVCTNFHYSICKTLGIETTENWYSHIPQPVCQHEDITLLQNQGLQTDREGLANRPDIIIKNMLGKICLLIDVAVPLDRNVIQKESEKKLKYKNLSTEIQQMWNMKSFVLEVVVNVDFVRNFTKLYFLQFFLVLYSSSISGSTQKL